MEKSPKKMKANTLGDSACLKDPVNQTHANVEGILCFMYYEKKISIAESLYLLFECIWLVALIKSQCFSYLPKSTGTGLHKRNYREERNCSAA